MNITNVTNSNDGYYRAVFSNTCGQDITTSANLKVQTANLNIGSLPTQTVCVGGDITLSITASGGGNPSTAQWEFSSNNGASWTNVGALQNGTGTITATVTINSATNPQAGLYRVHFIFKCGIAYSTPVTLTITTPAVTAGGPDNVCQSASPSPITLTGASFSGGPTTAAWSITSGGGALSSIAQTATPQTVTYKPGANFSGTVTLKLTTNNDPACGVVVSATRTITVNALPIVSTANACIGGGNVTFTQSAGAAGGTWSVTGGGTIVSSSGVFSPTTAGCFTATYTTPNGCTDTKNFLVFPTAPVITASSNTCNAAFIFHWPMYP